MARFVGSPSLNLLPVLSESGGQLQAAGMALPWRAAPGEGLMLGVRPEALRLAERGLPARIERVEQLGAETLLWCTAPGLGQTLVARIEPQAAAGLRVGAPLHLMPQHALLFGADGTRLPLVPAPEAVLAV